MSRDSTKTMRVNEQRVRGEQEPASEGPDEGLLSAAKEKMKESDNTGLVNY